MGIVAALAMMSSCSSDQPVPNVNSDGDTCEVSFKTIVPNSIATRTKTAFADGTTATRLSYALYRHDGDSKTLVLTKSNIDVVNLQSTVTLNLVSGETYDVVFWAAAKNAPYTFDAEAQTISVDYEDAAGNDEARDAFYYCVSDLEAGANTSRTITLRRPFAQLNIATSDKDLASRDAKFTVVDSEVEVEAYSSFNILTGDVTGEPAKVHFKQTRIPQGEVFPIDEDVYDYLAMNYLLMGNEQILSNVKLTLYSNEGASLTREYGNIPLRRNYRTNIYGQLLTATNEFNIKVDQNFAGAYNHYVEVENLSVNERTNAAGEVVGVDMVAGSSDALDNAIEQIHTVDSDVPVVMSLADNKDSEDGNYAYVDKCLNFDVPKSVTIDLNDHDLTITNGYSGSYYDGIVALNGAEVTIANGTFTFETNSSSQDGLYVYSDEAGVKSVLNVDNVEMHLENNYRSEAMHAVADNGGEAILNLNDGSIVYVDGSNSISAIYVQSNGTFNLNGGHIVVENSGVYSQSGSAITVDYKGVININSGIIDVKTTGEACAVEIGHQGAVVTMNGGTINLINAEGLASAFGYPYNSGTTGTQTILKGGTVNVNSSANGTAYAFYAMYNKTTDLRNPAVTIYKAAQININTSAGNNAMALNVSDDHFTYLDE
jgi:hypothetical protein